MSVTDYNVENIQDGGFFSDLDLDLHSAKGDTMVGVGHKSPIAQLSYFTTERNHVLIISRLPAGTYIQLQAMLAKLFSGLREARTHRFDIIDGLFLG